jgi:hypothetical protein
MGVAGGELIIPALALVLVLSSVKVRQHRLDVGPRSKVYRR